MKKEIIILMLLTLMVVACADVAIVDECLPDNPYGFWGGLWHGIVAPLAWLGSLFSSDIAVYAVNNNGGWYDFGFLLGIGGLGFGGGSGGSK
tara:strand:- start:29 stop:304 length:276 start_codon:yes stop_codon:yes gene_type:complete